MAKQKETIAVKKPVTTDTSFQFLRTYINNASPVGFESSGQKLWLDYIKPYVDTHFNRSLRHSRRRQQPRCSL